MSEHHHMDHEHTMGHMEHASEDHMHKVAEIDPSTMDHSQHSDHAMHGAMNMGQHAMMHMMKMYFHFGYEETILFSFWKISSITGLIASMVGIFGVAMLYEGLKYFREYLFWKTYSSRQYCSVESSANKGGGELEENPPVHIGDDVIHRQPQTMLSMPHILQTLLHIVQIVISYFLMLIFMTYNIWLCVAVILGAATGYFLFGWKKSLLIDGVASTEHCH